MKDAKKWEDGVEPTYRDTSVSQPSKIPGVLANYYKFLFIFIDIFWDAIDIWSTLGPKFFNFF